MYKELLAISYLTTKIGKIVSPLHKHEEKSKLHIFLKAPFGFTKTTEIMELVEKGIAHIVLEHSEAGLLGTVRAGMYHKGDLINGANKLTVIDEYFLFEGDARRHLLTLMSHGFTKRTIQSFSKTQFSDRGDGWEVKGDTSGFTLKINTAFALSTAVIERAPDAILEMIQSRCFNLNYTFLKPEAIDVLQGCKVVEKVKLKEIEYIDSVLLSEENAKYLANQIDKLSIVPEDLGGYYIRAYWDMAKIASVYAVQEGRNEITKDDIDSAIVFYPIHSLGFIGNKLTVSEMLVYRVCRYKTIEEIVKEVNLSERQVRRILNRLKELKLIKEISYGGKKVFVSVIDS